MRESAWKRAACACAAATAGQNAPSLEAFEDDEPPTLRRAVRLPLVVVAEPDAEVCATYAERLADIGCRVRTASHADEVLRVVAEAPPDLVLIEVSMARACRGNVARWLREAGASRVVGLAPPGSEWEQHAREARLDALIRKPTAPAIFERTVRELLPSTIANNVVHRITGR